MKIFALPAGEDWICDRIVEEWRKFNPELTVKTAIESDVIWLVSNWLWRSIPYHILQNKKVVTTIHHIDNDKFNLQEFMERDKITDHYHVYDKLTEQKLSLLTNKPVTRILHWYDRERFFPMNKTYCRDILDIKINEYVIGSFQRDTEGHDLKSPKLSKGPDILCDYLEKVQSNINYLTRTYSCPDRTLHVLLGGWRRQYVIDRLEKAGIKYTYIEKASEHKLKLMYGALDMYAVTSRTEGGPQAIIEATAMNIPMISTHVGIAEDILHENDVYTHEKLRKCINDETFYTLPVKHVITDPPNWTYTLVTKLDINTHKQKYIEMFKSVLEV